MEFSKAQSAMEYLMTYGWAILIIAIVMVALFALGVFNPPVSTTCEAVSGYQCSAVTFNHGNIGTYPAGNVVMTFGENTGVDWVAANVFWVPQFWSTTVSGVPSIIPSSGLTLATESGEGNIIVGGLVSGQTAQVSLPVFGANTSPINLGATVSGTVWAQYWTASGGPYYNQIQTGVLNLNAK